MTDIAHGIAFIHARSFAHGHLSTCNILVTSDWHAKLAEYRIVGRGGSSLSARHAIYAPGETAPSMGKVDQAFAQGACSMSDDSANTTIKCMARAFGLPARAPRLGGGRRLRLDGLPPPLPPRQSGVRAGRRRRAGEDEERQRDAHFSSAQT